LLFAAGDQLFELMCLLVAADYGGNVDQEGRSFMVRIETSNCTVLTESHLQLSLGNGNWKAH
jgi:hypothetical protein